MNIRFLSAVATDNYYNCAFGFPSTCKRQKSVGESCSFIGNDCKAELKCDGGRCYHDPKCENEPCISDY